MKTLTRSAFIAMVLLLLLGAANRTAAQPCGASVITFGNNTACVVTICLNTSLGVVCQTLNPGASAVVPLVAPVTILDVISAGNINYPFTPSPIPGFQWVPNVTLRPVNCCCDVYYDPATCTVKAVPSSGPPPCNP